MALRAPDGSLTLADVVGFAVDPVHNYFASDVGANDNNDSDDDDGDDNNDRPPRVFEERLPAATSVVSGPAALVNTDYDNDEYADHRTVLSNGTKINHDLLTNEAGEPVGAVVTTSQRLDDGTVWVTTRVSYPDEDGNPVETPPYGRRIDEDGDVVEEGPIHPGTLGSAFNPDLERLKNQGLLNGSSDDNGGGDFLDSTNNNDTVAIGIPVNMIFNLTVSYRPCSCQRQVICR